jgi:hypothetical protein
MAKTKQSKLPESIEQIRPYLERALTDPAFRKDLKHALEAARELYAPLAKAEGGVASSAKLLVTDKKAQESLRRAVEEIGSAATTLKGAKAGGKRGRKGLLLAGVVAGALYNPWTGTQTRQWLLDRIAGDDDLQPLQDLVPPVPDSAGNGG